MIIAATAYAISVKTDLSSKTIDITVVVVITSITAFIATITSNFSFHIDSQLKSILSNNITVYDSSRDAVKLIAIVNEFSQI